MVWTKKSGKKQGDSRKKAGTIIIAPGLKRVFSYPTGKLKSKFPEKGFPAPIRRKFRVWRPVNHRRKSGSIRRYTRQTHGLTIYSLRAARKSSLSPIPAYSKNRSWMILHRSLALQSKV